MTKIEKIKILASIAFILFVYWLVNYNSNYFRHKTIDNYLKKSIKEKLKSKEYLNRGTVVLHFESGDSLRDYYIHLEFCEDAQIGDSIVKEKNSDTIIIRRIDTLDRKYPLQYWGEEYLMEKKSKK